jgi:hypothetical protein
VIPWSGDGERATKEEMPEAPWERIVREDRATWPELIKHPRRPWDKKDDLWFEIVAGETIPEHERAPRNPDL